MSQEQLDQEQLQKSAGTASPLQGSGLGQVTEYPQSYAPEVLFPVPRADNRATLGHSVWPWFGFDLWYAYELSWLNRSGLPQVALAAIEVPAHSTHIVESKSLKLYLNSLNMTQFGQANDVAAMLSQDLSRAAGAPVQVTLHPADDPQMTATGSLPDGAAVCLDRQDIVITQYTVQSDLLQTVPDKSAEETLYSQLLRSNCPVTGQPDWGSVVIDYAGPALDHAALLRYIVSYRNHTGFHEHCVERIFTDLLALGEFARLSVRAHYLRRGGLDINPCRSLHQEYPDMRRWARQ